ncbi:unnamed protein product [Notodromas monacha]|uniref:alkaline phosphatase n=1 Tax=Notodromas monacha TaxID=399045 RepID=A0A7R9BN36_9CRUS|nr:unnamed protein product [Notodromas monacha]CAG0917724.1 unnamed protein product [Notodromas monacha]
MGVFAGIQGGAQTIRKTVRRRIAEVQDEYELPYTTLMFMNGASYHYQNNGTHIQWKNLTNVDTQDINFMQHSGIYMPSGKETHGGEDIPAYAIGPWGHLLNGVHHLPYLGHLTQFSACIGEYLDDCEERSKATDGLAYLGEVLEAKYNSSTVMGLGSFQLLDKLGYGVSKTLSGYIQKSSTMDPILIQNPSKSSPQPVSSLAKSDDEISSTV